LLTRHRRPRSVVAPASVSLAQRFGTPSIYDELAKNVLAGRGYVYHHLGDAPFRSFYSGVPYVALTAATYWLAADGRTAMLVAQAFWSGRHLGPETLREAALVAVGKAIHTAR